MQISRIYTSGWINAMIGMRFPKDSEAQSDSLYEEDGTLRIGPADFALANKLIKAGRSHRKFLRFIHVQAAVKMPISWWIQYDTYKVGTVANSRSRMHMFGKRRLLLQDFFVPAEDRTLFFPIIEKINQLIDIYNTSEVEAQRTQAWHRALRLLPMSYLQERMIDFSLENLHAMYSERWNDKLTEEWRFFLCTLISQIPYNGFIQSVVGQMSEVKE